MNALPQRPQTLLRAAGLRAKKTWGQNFLCDENVLKTIAQAVGAGPEQPVLELGAGLGALTHHLLQQGGPVIAVERDRDLIAPLRAHLDAAFGGTAERLTVLEADVGRLDYGELAALHGPLSVAGNLPYQLSSRILVNLADARGAVSRAVLLVQREVAERLLAGPPGRDYGLLTVLVQRTFTVECLRQVPPQAFFPAPKVHSTVIRLTLRTELADAAADAAGVRAARAAFSTRRKTLRNAIAGACQVSGADAEAALRAAHILPEARAETLHLADFMRLGAVLCAAGWLPPKQACSDA